MATVGGRLTLQPEEKDTRREEDVLAWAKSSSSWIRIEPTTMEQRGGTAVLSASGAARAPPDGGGFRVGLEEGDPVVGEWI
jgi:hypothetical protein